MPVRTEVEQGPPYSADEFLLDLEDYFGGPLYLGVTDAYKPFLQDIRSRTNPALKTLRHTILKAVPAAPLYTLTKDPLIDFHDLIMLEMPDTQLGRHFIHTLANPFSRGVLTERLELFFAECAQNELHSSDNQKILIIQDKLPFDLVFSGVIFDTSELLPSLLDYFKQAKERASELADSLNLTAGQKRLFEKYFIEGVEILEGGMILNLTADRDPIARAYWESLPPIIKAGCMQAIILWQLKHLPPSE